MIRIDWDLLDLPDWRSRFFIESYIETLSIYTPHFHQAKVMGLIGLSKEVITNISEYEANDKGKGYLIASLKELQEVFDSDEIAQKIFEDFKLIFKNCTQELLKDKISSILIFQLSILCKRILAEEKKYFEELGNELKNVIIGNFPIEKKGILTNKINLLTKQYVTYLLNYGYSPTFLYNKSEVFTRKNNYKSRNFAQQLDMFLQTLNCKVRDFNVFHAISTNKKYVLEKFKAIGNIEILDKIPEKHFIISTKTFASFTPDFYIKSNIEAYDYIEASWKASDALESELDYLQTLYPNINLNLHTNCYVDYKIQGCHYQREVKINLLNKLIAYDYKNNKLNKFIESNPLKKLSKDSLKTLEGVFQNLRFAKETSRFEQKLLYYWIAIETLNFSSDEQSIISSIVRFVPKLYAIKSITDRLMYVLILLSKESIKIPESIQKRHNITIESFETSFDIDLFYKIIEDKNSANELYKILELGNYDLINFRLIALHELIKSPSNIRLRIQNTETDIERQIYRIYRYRNHLIHNGHAPSFSHFAINHLAEYVNNLLYNILENLDKSKYLKNISLNDILLSSHLVVDNYYKKMKTSDFKGYEDLKDIVII